MDNQILKLKGLKSISRRLVISFCGALMLLTTALGSVLAGPPAIPSSFYGTLSINGKNVDTNEEVSAWIDGVMVIAVPVLLHNETTVYTIDVPGDDPTTPEIEGGVHGDEVIFYIGSQLADQTGTWLSGANQELNLSSGQAVVRRYFFPLFTH